MHRAAACVSPWSCLWAVLWAVVLLASLATAQDPGKQPVKKVPKSPVPVLEVQSAPAPVIDGAMGTEEWAKGVDFVVKRPNEVFGRGWVLRSGRQLYIGFRSEDADYALGVRVMIVDPVTGRRTIVIAAPIHPPRPPLVVARVLPGKPVEMLSAATCDVRFDLKGEKGFVMELRLPMDLLEIARSDKGYGFAVEMWDLIRQKILAGFPLVIEGTRGGRGEARLLPVGDWDAEEAVAAAPRQPALALLEDLDKEQRWFVKPGRGKPPDPILQVYLGNRDGRRRDEPLKKLQARLSGLVARYPDYISLRASLMRVLRGRNDYEGALAVHRSILRDFPLTAHNLHSAFVEAEMLFALGHYEEGLALVKRRANLLSKKEAERLRLMFTGSRDSWRAELAIRAAEKQRDDLPRVRIETTKGAFVLELFEDDAPNAVANFITLVEEKFYDGTRFHWVSGGDRALGGDGNSKDKKPSNDGFGDPGYMIESNPGRRLQFPYTITFADKRFQRRTEGSTFAIHITPLPELDGLSTVFGRVIEGRDAVRRLEYYDTIRTARVLRKRDHPYKVVKR